MDTTDLPGGTYGEPVVSRPEDREQVDYHDTTFEVVLRTEQTGRRFFMNRERDIRPETAPPFHVHAREDEIWIVHGGTFRFWIGGESLDTAETFDVGPGSVVYGPRDVPHTFQSLGESGDVTILWSPGDSQAYFLGVGHTDAREGNERVDSLEEIGVTILDRAPVNGA